MTGELKTIEQEGAFDRARALKLLDDLEARITAMSEQNEETRAAYERMAATARTAGESLETLQTNLSEMLRRQWLKGFTTGGLVITTLVVVAFAIWG